LFSTVGCAMARRLNASRSLRRAGSILSWCLDLFYQRFPRFVCLQIFPLLKKGAELFGSL
jgi:hypothetical protein